jgi:hypothetical protein
MTADQLHTFTEIMTDGEAAPTHLNQKYRAEPDERMAGLL